MTMVATADARMVPLVGHMTAEQKAAVRTRVEAVVHRLTAVLEDMIAALDQLDGDPDLESSMGYQPYPDECEGDGSDNEPSLGWTSTVNQSAGAWHGPIDGYGFVDREDEHDGAEPDVDHEDGGDDEPSLCGQCVTVGRSMVDGTPLWPE
jgi:hypothetical protein